MFGYVKPSRLETLRPSSDFKIADPVQLGLPKAVDWRTKRAVTPVQNMIRACCQSSYAFAAVSA